ncbi:MAG: DUF202 domain-containing protein [Ilumatobacteraceae bacterium]
MTPTAAARPPNWASQPERTSLAWTRTSLGFLANGVFLMLKYVHADAPPIILAAGGLAVAVTLWVYLIGGRRQRLLARQPFPRSISPRREVYVVAALVQVLVCVSLLPLLL